MPNNAYLRSTKREREIVNKARAQGLDAGRTAGSHSPWDVYIWDKKDRVMRLVQVKTKIHGKFLTMKDEKVYSPVTLITATYSYAPLTKKAKRITGLA